MPSLSASPSDTSSLEDWLFEGTSVSSSCFCWSRFTSLVTSTHAHLSQSVLWRTAVHNGEWGQGL